MKRQRQNARFELGAEVGSVWRFRWKWPILALSGLCVGAFVLFNILYDPRSACTNTSALGEIRDARSTSPVDELFDEGRTVACSIEDYNNREFALMDLAAAMVEAGRFDEAVLLARGIDFEPKRAAALGDIAISMVHAGNLERALELARTEQGDYTRAQVLSKIGGVVGDASLFKDSIVFARGIENRDLVLDDIAVSMAEAGLFDEALAIAPEYEFDQNSKSMVFQVANAMAEKGLFDEAMELMNSVAPSDDLAHNRKQALRYIEDLIARTARFEKELAHARGFGVDTTGIQDRLGIVVALAKAGLVDEAVRMARSFEDDPVRGYHAANYHKGDNLNMSRDRALIGIAYLLTEEGRFDEAFGILQGIDHKRTDGIGEPDLTGPV